MSGLTAASSAEQSRDEEVSAFFAAHYMAVRRYVIASGCPDYEADDVLQDTILAVRENWDTVRTLDKPVAYWYKAAGRRFWRWAKERARRLPACDYEDHLLAVPDPADEVAAMDCRLVIMACIQGLAAGQRQVIWLRLAVGFDVAETADIMSVTPGTVKSQLHDAKKRLGQLLLEDAGQDAWVGVSSHRYLCMAVSSDPSQWEADELLAAFRHRGIACGHVNYMSDGPAWKPRACGPCPDQPDQPVTPVGARGPPRQSRRCRDFYEQLLSGGGAGNRGLPMSGRRQRHVPYADIELPLLADPLPPQRYQHASLDNGRLSPAVILMRLLI